MAHKIEYQIVGRYMNGKEVTGYHLMNLNTNKNRRYTREQVAFLVGRGQVTNCSGRIYQDKLLLEGIGMSLNDLPVKQENGSLSRTDSIGKIRKGTTTAEAMTQVMLTHAIVHDNDTRKVLGYIAVNAGGATINLDKARVLTLAKEGRVGNARVQQYNGKLLLRGVGVSLADLPNIKASVAGVDIPNNEDKIKRIKYIKAVIEKQVNPNIKYPFVNFYIDDELLNNSFEIGAYSEQFSMGSEDKLAYYIDIGLNSISIQLTNLSDNARYLFYGDAKPDIIKTLNFNNFGKSFVDSVISFINKYDNWVRSNPEIFSDINK